MSARRDAAANQPGPSSGFRSQFLRRVEKPRRESDSGSGSLVSAMSHMGSETPRQSHNLPESDESSVDEHAAGPSARPDPDFVVPGAEARVPSSCDPKIRLPPHLNLTSSEKRRKFSRQEAVSEQTSDEKLNPNNKLFGEFDSSDDESGSAKGMGSTEDDFMMEVAEHVSKRVELTYVPNMVVHDLTSEGLGYSKVLVCDEFAAYGTPNGAIQLTLKTAMEPNFLGRDYRDRSPISEDHINVIFDDFSKSLKDAESSGWAHESAELTGHRTAVTSMAYCHRYSVLFSGVLDGEIRGWDAFNHRCIQNYESHTGIVWDLAVCPGGESFASASEDSTVKLYTLSRPDPLRIFVGHWRGIQKIAFAPDGLRVASASGDFSVKVFDVNSGGGVCHLEHSHSSVVNSLDYSACGNYMAIACQDASLSVWDLRNRRRSLFCRGNAPMISASFAFDGTSILSLQENGDMYSYKFSTDGAHDNVPHYVLPLCRNRYKPVSFARDFHGPNFRLVRCPMRTVPARPVAAFGYAC